VAIGQQGRTDESLALACSLQTLAGAAGDSVHLGWAWLGQAYGHYLAGRADAAGDLYARAGGVLARSGVPRGAVWARNGEGLARRQAGDFEGAMAAFRTTACLAREVGDALSEAMALAYQGRLELLVGDPEAASRLLDQAVAIHDRHHHHREGLLPRIDLAAARRLAGRHQSSLQALSGGERQRVAVARALINKPSLLLCDEPTGNLDQDSGKKVIDLLIELAAEQHVTVVMVTHNRDFAARFGRCVALRDGRLFEKGSSD